MNIRLKPIVVAIALALFVAFIIMPIDATSQERKGKEPSSDEVMSMMGPMMSNMMQVMMESMLTTMAKPQTAERLATFTKNYYDALIAKGFSKEDALKIVVSVGIPSVPMMK